MGTILKVYAVHLGSAGTTSEITFCAELVPKSFSTKVATAIAIANNTIYSPAVEVEKSVFEIFLRSFIRWIIFIVEFG